VGEAERERIVEGLGSGEAAQGAPEAVVAAAQAAYVHAIGDGMRIGAVAVLLAAIAAWRLIGATPPAAPQRTVPEHAAEGEAALAAPAVTR
jgi:hypothetical protein